MKTILSSLLSDLSGMFSGYSTVYRPVAQPAMRVEARDVEPDGNIDPVEDGTIEVLPVPADVIQAGPEPSLDSQNHQPPREPPTVPAEVVETKPETDGNGAGQQLDEIRRLADLQGTRLQVIEEALGAMGEDRRLLEGQEAIIRDLSTRLRQAEEAQAANAIIKPVISGLIQLFDTVWSARQDWGKHRPANADEWISNCLATLDGEILQMLNAHGVVQMTDTTDVLDPKRQRVVRTESPRQWQDGAILERGRPGFYRNGQVERPEEVVSAKVRKEVAK